MSKMMGLKDSGGLIHCTGSDKVLSATIDDAAEYPVFNADTDLHKNVMDRIISTNREMKAKPDLSQKDVDEFLRKMNRDESSTKRKLKNFKPGKTPTS